jgi:hypothetical protein
MRNTPCFLVPLRTIAATPLQPCSLPFALALHRVRLPRVWSEYGGGCALCTWGCPIRKPVHRSPWTRRTDLRTPSRGRLGYSSWPVRRGRMARVAPPPSGVVLAQVRPSPWTRRLPGGLTHEEPARVVAREPPWAAIDPPPNADTAPVALMERFWG